MNERAREIAKTLKSTSTRKLAFIMERATDPDRADAAWLVWSSRPDATCNLPGGKARI